MSLSKREFLQVLGAAAVAGMGLARYENADAQTAEAGLYDLPPLGRGAGQVSFLHMTDCHAQLKPIYFREPSVNLGIGSMQGQLPHLVGETLLKKAGVPAGTQMAHALTFLDFERAAQRYGRVGGFAHLSTLVKRLKLESVKEPQPEVHIRGDSEVRYESVGRVVVACQRAGIFKVGFITEPPAGVQARLN